MTPRERAQAVERMEQALACAEALRMVLELAITDLRTNPDEREVANVVQFATTYTVRQSAAIHGYVSGTP